MKLVDVKLLAERGGVFNMTALDSDAKVAYKIFKFRKEIKKAYEAIGEQERELLKDNGIDVNTEFDKNGQYKFEGDDSHEKWDRFSKLRDEMYNSETTIDVEPLSYDEWFRIYKENKDKISPFVEDILEGVLWKQSNEEEDKK